jgi:hypothetical protein
MVAADSLERPMRRASGAHVVLGMYFEESRVRAFRQNRVQVLMLEAGSGEARDDDDQGERPLSAR